MSSLSERSASLLWPGKPLASFLVMAMMLAGCSTDSGPEYSERAQALAERFIIVDGHIDVPYRMARYTEDISRATIGGDFDYPRAKAGGLNAPFMSIYIPSSRQDVEGAARALADSLIDMVEGFVENAPDKFAIATHSSDLLAHKNAGLVSLPMGIENGAPIHSVADLEHFYARGIRYITLTHGRDNQLCDSSYDSTRTWNGLSPLGEEIVDNMNRLGIMVGVSPLTDSTIFQVLRRSRAPVIASHSSARHFTPGWERNMSDTLIQALAANDGVIMISYGSSFVRGAYLEPGRELAARIDQHLTENSIEPGSEAGVRYREEQRKSNPLGTLAEAVDHIDYVVDLVGIDHVGLGSDFDGVTALPAGLQDASTYPGLIDELLRRGYSDEDIGKILGGNAIRVWEAVERLAADS